MTLLVAGAMLSFYAILTSGRAEAQEDEGCADPQTVDTFNGTQNQITRPFNITGNTFRLRYDLTDADDDPENFTSFSLRPIGEDGIGVGQSVLVFDPETASQNILEGPGSFTLEIESGGLEYSVTVEDCTGTAPGNAETSTPEASQPTPAPKATPKQKEKVMRKTVPKRPLPPTGGTPTSYAIYGFVLGGASLLALGLVRRGR
jgi:hypothetical protein